MSRKGISDQGFHRLARFLQAQAWGGDELVVVDTAVILQEYDSSALGMQSTSLGPIAFIYECSDGAKLYRAQEAGVLEVVVTPEGEQITLQELENNPGHYRGDDTLYLYFQAVKEYGSSAPKHVATPEEVAELNGILGTSYQAMELSDEDAQYWLDYIEQGGW